MCNQIYYLQEFYICINAIFPSNLSAVHTLLLCLQDSRDCFRRHKINFIFHIHTKTDLESISQV